LPFVELSAEQLAALARVDAGELDRAGIRILRLVSGSAGAIYPDGLDFEGYLAEESEPSSDARGALLPTELVEKAVRLHLQDGRGRRVLGREQGLTDWYAGQILSWLRRGEPTGLWLDQRGKLAWGTAITPVWLDREQAVAGSATACSHLRLPRI
jgi:hypothetical protein